MNNNTNKHSEQCFKKLTNLYGDVTLLGKKIKKRIYIIDLLLYNLRVHLSTSYLGTIRTTKTLLVNKSEPKIDCLFLP